MFVKETLGTFKPRGEFIAPVMKLLTLTRSNHLTFPPGGGETLTPAFSGCAFSDSGKYFLPENQHTC